MQAQAPKYRVCTIEPVTQSDVAASFAEHLSDAALTSRFWMCEDGTELIFHCSLNPDLYFVEFRCQFHVKPMKTINYGLLPNIIEFCRSHGGRLKILRNGDILPASGGIYSDVFRSRANRVAEHLSQHPKDNKAVLRHTNTFCSNPPINRTR